MDSSGSMKEATGGTGMGPSKWEAVKTAITAFVQEPQSNGIGMAMQFFPLLYPNVPASCTASSQCGTHGPCELKACGPTPGQTTQPSYIPCDSTNDCPTNRTCLNLCECSLGGTFYMQSGSPNTVGCMVGGNTGTCTRVTSSTCADGNSCDAAQYDTPAVTLSQLPVSANSIIQAMNRTPIGPTPTAPALRGAISRAQELSRANPTHTTIALLVTDGLPTICSPTAIADVAALAEQGLSGDAGAGTPGVKTFVVGVFTDAEANAARSNLNMIAQKGGTNTAFIITTSGNVAQEFLAALNTVRASALPCDYEVPRPDSGMPDYDKVNVRFTSGAGAKETLPYVGSVGGCAGVTRGWYYDVNPSGGATPTKISMCPDICTALKADSQGKVDVLLGCKTSIR